jgi:hypothetical protein
VTAELSAVLEASAAFFLIADISGRGLVRLSQASADPAGVRAELGGPGGPPRLDDDEQAADLPVAGGGPAGEALRTLPGRARAALRRDRQPPAHRPVRMGPAQRAERRL